MRSLGQSLVSFLVVICLISVIILQPALVSAQTSSKASPPATQWQNLYGEGYTEQVSNLIQTNDGGYAFLDCGKAYQLTFAPATFYKIDSSGDMQWNETIDHFAGHSLIQTSDGGYEISGMWSTYGTTYQSSPTVIKTDSEGNIQWYENTSTVLDLAISSSSIQTSDGGFASCRQGNAILNPPNATLSPTIVKTDPNNNTQWIENLTYSGPANYLNGTIWFPFKMVSLIETSDGAVAGLGIADPHLQPQGLWGYIYLIKTMPFLPSPSKSPLSTPLPSPTPTSTMIPSPSPTSTVPEFPSWKILPFLVTTTVLLSLAIRRRRAAQ